MNRRYFLIFCWEDKIEQVENNLFVTRKKRGKIFYRREKEKEGEIVLTELGVKAELFKEVNIPVTEIVFY